jgi:hypothetical protein
VANDNFSNPQLEPERKREEFLAIIKQAAIEIIPQDVKLTWRWGSILDPYGVYPPLEEDNVGRLYFAFAPFSKVWICFYDLPRLVADGLWRGIEAGELRFDDDDRLPWDDDAAMA